MKPVPMFLFIAFSCLLLAILLPQLLRVQIAQTGASPASAFALGSASSILEPYPTPVLEMPVTSGKADDLLGYPGLTDFAATLLNGQVGEVVGVYVPGVLALPVRQQPNSQPDYVSRSQNEVTQFALPKKYGSTGLLAHNYLSGSAFLQLQAKQDVVLIYGDGSLEHYRISQIEAFQALKPDSPFSNFVSLTNFDQKQTLTSADLFNQIYTINHSLVFQTCIEKENEPSWGRIFIIATLAEPLHLTVPDTLPMTSIN